KLINYEHNLTAVDSDLYRATLKIGVMKSNDYGDYVCKASNVRGVQSVAVRVQSKGPPEMPSDLLVLEKSHDAVRLGWKEGFSGGNPNTNFVVNYLKANDRNHREFDCQQSNPCVISGLEQQTK